MKLGARLDALTVSSSDTFRILVPELSLAQIGENEWTEKEVETTCNFKIRFQNKGTWIFGGGFFGSSCIIIGETL